MKVREKKHRLPDDYYIGEMAVAFTLCIKSRNLNFPCNEIVEPFVEIFAKVSRKNSCIVPCYCFMPDHQHLVMQGIQEKANIKKAIIGYKQCTGFWLSKNMPSIRWQKDFFDHVIRGEENLSTQVKYVLDNPVRKGLVETWDQYPFKGSIGCKLEEVLLGILN